MANPDRKASLTADLPTKSAKIRALDQAGYSRTEIADFLGIRYQHVRNVLVNDARAGRPGGPADRREAQAVRPTKVRIGPDGRIVIPAAFRDALGLKENDVLVATLEAGDIRLQTISAAVRQAQAIVRQFVPEGVSLVDELMAERRRDAEREASNG